MSPTYRLETLRRLRQSALEEAQANLAACAEKRAAREAALEAALGRYQEAVSQQRSWTARTRQSLEAPFHGAQWRRDHAYGQRKAAQVEAKRLEVRTATDQLTQATKAEVEARDALVQARKALEILEKDRAAFHKKERREQERQRELEADDIATSRWEREP